MIAFIGVVVAAVYGLAVKQSARLPDVYVHLYPPTIEHDAEGHRLVVFATQVGNRGSAPLEVQGEPREACHASDGRAGVAAYQRLLDLGVQRTPVTRVRVGCLVFSPSHGHWHVADLLTYTVRSEQGHEVYRREKVGFCLADGAPGDTAKGSTRPAPRYRAPGIGKNCAGEAVLQGLSPGWTDVYGSSTPGQSIDVSSVPDSTYCLVATVRLGNASMVEGGGQDEDRVRFEIRGGTLRVLGRSC